MMRYYHLDTVPTAEQYAQALRQLEDEGRLTDIHRRLLAFQYLRPSHTTTATILSQELGIAVITVNRDYGGLGHLIADQLNVLPSEREGGGYRWWCMLSSGDTEGGYFQWEMYMELAQAIEQLNLVDSIAI